MTVGLYHYENKTLKIHLEGHPEMHDMNKKRRVSIIILRSKSIKSIESKVSDSYYTEFGKYSAVYFKK